MLIFAPRQPARGPRKIPPDMRGGSMPRRTLPVKHTSWGRFLTCLEAGKVASPGRLEACPTEIIVSASLLRLRFRLAAQSTPYYACSGCPVQPSDYTGA